MAGSTDQLFSHTLLEITTAKLEQLAKKRDTFESRHADVVARVHKEPNDLEKIKILSNGLKHVFSVAIAEGEVIRGSTSNPRLEIDLKNFDYFLAQANYDPSISTQSVRQWQEALTRHLDVQSLKYLYADLYGRLTTEWLSSKQRVIPQASKEDMDTDDYEKISGPNRIESRLKWEQSVFEAADVSRESILAMLRGIFERPDDDSKKFAEALKELRNNVKDAERTLANPGNFSLSSLKWTINSLVSSDLLTEEKRTVLKGFLENSIILGEIADVLNMRMSALDEWSWGEVVHLEERRQLSGSFNIYMHEDILQAIFLQFIGIKWSVALKRAFTTFHVSSRVWKTAQESTLSPLDKKRRDFFLGPQLDRSSVSSRERWLYRKHFFVYQLYGHEQQSTVADQGDEEANFEDNHAQQVQQAQQMPQQQGMYHLSVQQPPRHRQVAARSQASHPGLQKKRRVSVQAAAAPAHSHEYEESDEDEDSGNDFKSPMKAKQTLLHLFATRTLLNTRLHGEQVCFRSQVESLFPSLPHCSILTVLEYFGVSEKWVSFFKRFLEAPLQFIDDRSSPPRKRMRGTPGSHVLSEVFGEAVLFCLDFRVNSVANGNLLWRMGDDFWFWSSDQGSCVTAWRTVDDFVKITGLSLNQNRSGSARMLRESSRPNHLVSTDVGPDLPRGQIRWGMLYLNPASGSFEIDQDMVDQHIDEMSRQLEGKKDSIFAWIQGWNSYASTFFNTNFGKPANCFGRQHVDRMLATHERIQRKIFASSADVPKALSRNGGGSVVEFLRQIMENRFGIKDVPDGYFFFPSEMGGLEIRSPFINLVQLREATEKQPSKLVGDFLDNERESYRMAKMRFESGETHQAHDDREDPNFEPHDANTFFSFEEFVKHREVSDPELRKLLKHLLAPPTEQTLDIDNHGVVINALNAISNQQNSRGPFGNWYSMDPYWKWVAQLHGPEMIQRFGGLRIVDSGLLPTGMVSLLRNARLDWQE